jgi:hypothetical protein
MKSCLSCEAPIPDIPANRTRKRCVPCADEHHRRTTAEKRSARRREVTWGQPFTCPICQQDFMQEQRVGVPATYCPQCTAIRRFGSAR